MAINKFLIDASTRRQVFLQRYGDGEGKKAVKHLTKLRRDINARIRSNPTNIQRSRLVSMLADIDDLFRSANIKISASITKGAQDLAAVDADFAVKLYDRVSKVSFRLPSNQALIAAVENAPMVPRAGAVSINLEDALTEFGTKKAEQVRQIINDSIVLGDNTAKVAKKVNEVISSLHARQLRALTQTAMNHASSVAREETYKENARLLNGYEWVATLDISTTLVCAGRDGKIYIAGRGPMPPAHWNCRSTTIPKVKSQFTSAAKLTGDRPSVGDKGVAKISANKSYGGWLKTQPKSFIDEVLGPERSKLFRSGKVSIGGFTDQSGRVYTLLELQGLDELVLQR